MEKRTGTSVESGGLGGVRGSVIPASMVDWMESVVWLERLDDFEVEKQGQRWRQASGQGLGRPESRQFGTSNDDAEVGCQIGEELGSSSLPKLSALPLSWHILVDVRFGGGGCHEDFRP